METAPVTLTEIHRYMAATGMSARRFGEATVNDPRFVYGLRNGREPYRKTHLKLRAFLDTECARLGLLLDGTDPVIGCNPITHDISAEAARLASGLGASGNHRRILAAIIEAALAGNYCPSNVRFCAILSGATLGMPPQYLSALERAGLVKVTRFQRGRDIYIPSLGISTAPYTGARSLHWRDQNPAHRKGLA